MWGTLAKAVNDIHLIVEHCGGNHRAILVTDATKTSECWHHIQFYAGLIFELYVIELPYNLTSLFMPSIN
jgi:hypothetical protein